MSTLRVFKSTIPSVNFIFPNGKPAIFQQGRYYTDNTEDIATLDKEIKDGHPHIYIDNEEMTIESEMLNPVNAMKAKVLGTLSRDELIAALQAKEADAINPSNDMGSSEQLQVKPASTQDIASAAAGGSGASLTSRLTNLGKKA